MTDEDRKKQNDALTKKLEAGILDSFTNKRFQSFLKMTSKFHSYSFRNTLLISLQRPDATQIAGFNVWRKLGRHVKSGEKGIAIFAPVLIRKKKRKADHEKDSLLPSPEQPDTGNSDDDIVIHYRVAYIFDVAQTDGDPLPEICPILTGSVPNYDSVYQALCAVSPFPVSFDNISNGALGYCDHANRRIVLDQSLPDAQTVKTLIHEIGYAVMHSDSSIPREQKEVEAEATAYIVAEHIGLDTSSYSFDYIADWALGMDIKTLSEVLAGIQNFAHQLITSIDDKLAELSKTDKRISAIGSGTIDDKISAACSKAKSENFNRCGTPMKGEEQDAKNLFCG